MYVLLVDKVVSEVSEVDSEKTAVCESKNALTVKSTSVDMAVSDSHDDRSTLGLPSTTTLPLPPPPPPPFPTDPTAVGYFPALPPPPVECLPVRMPPPHTYPDVRWRLDSVTPRHSAMFPQCFHPPPVLRHAPQPFNHSQQIVPVTNHSQTKRDSHPNTSQTNRSSSLSSATVTSTVSEMVSSASTAKSSSRPVIRDFKAKGAIPRFVPRQLRGVQTAGTNSSKVVRSRDPVVEELKQNAFVLGSRVQGPSLPSQVERKRKEFKASETGNESLDRTVHVIRQKVSQVCCDCSVFKFIVGTCY